MKHILIRFLSILLMLMTVLSPALASEKLQRGDKGQSVLQMQKALNQMGYSLKADGVFGAGTLEAVRDFQKKHDLKTDGIAGNQTLTLLYQIAGTSAANPTTAPAPESKPAASTASYATLRPGDTGSRVNELQQMLNKVGFSLKADGKYGSGTKNAVLSFQKSHGLTADGVAGSKTLTLLYQLTQNTAVVPTTAPANTPAPTPAATAPAAVPTTYATLRKGDSGEKVLSLQKALNQMGYSLKTDGKYGAGTQSAVKDFQQKNGLKSDGTAGNQTLTRLYQLLSALETASAPTAAPAAPAPTAASAPVDGQSATVSTGNYGSLNLRKQANDSAAILCAVPNGTVLQVISKGTSWCAVSYNGQTGYVMTSFLRFDDEKETASPTATPSPAAAADHESAIVTTSGGPLNLRSGASSNASVTATIPNAAAITVSERGKDWCRVSYNGKDGYVMTSFLTFLSPAPTATPAPAEPEKEESDPSAYTRTLKNGMTGEDVRWVQTRLKELGYTVTVSGTYDAATAAAVKSFQNHNALEADGMAGSQTFAVLRSGNARKASDPVISYTTLRVDNTGSGVSTLQTALKNLGYSVSVNGTYDVATHNAVVAFQQRNELVISGIADGLTLQVLYGGNGKPFSTPVQTLEADAGKMTAPDKNSIQCLKWYTEVKPSIKTGQSCLVYDPNTGLSWKLQFYSLGHHADSQPLTWRDTQIMNRSFGSTSWNVHPVYVKLPDGRWTIATMHNRPHLYGTITDNGFGGHLCVHFLREISECISAGDSDYGVQNQRTLRSAWKALTGETILDNFN